MTSEPRSSASYAYYSFPATPTRSSPTPSTQIASLTTPTPSARKFALQDLFASKDPTLSPQTARTSKGMALPPAAGKKPAAPSTPTKQGRNPASGAAQRLGQSSLTSAAISSTNTPHSGAEGAVGKAPQGATGAAGNLSKTADKADKTARDAQGKANQTMDKADNAKRKLHDTKDEAEDATGGIDVKDDDPTKEADDEGKTFGGKISRAGNETQNESFAVLTLNDDDGLSEAVPNPVDDDDDNDNDAAKGAADQAKDTAEDTTEKARDATKKMADGDAEGAAEDKAHDAADDVKGAAPDEVDGVVDQAKDTVDEAKDTAEEAVDDLLVNLSVLEDLEVGKDGKILNAGGEQIGQLDEGDLEDLASKTIGDNGEILDEDGNALAVQAPELADQAKGGLPEIGTLEGLKVGEDGNIVAPDGNAIGETLDEDGDIVGRAMVVPGIDIMEGHEVGENGKIFNEEGEVIGQLTEGDAEQLAGQMINDAGEILNEDGYVIGRADLVLPGVEYIIDEAKEDVEGEVDEAAEAALCITPDYWVLEGKKIKKEGKILDDEGEPIGQLTEASDLKKCAGKIPNENSEILDAEGNVVGKIEVLPGEAADEAIEALHLNYSSRQPKVVKKPCAGKKINEKGEVVNKDGNVIGKVEVIQGETADEAMKELNLELLEQAKEAAVDAVTPDMSILEGLKVNKKGEVVNEDGDKINDKAEILDDEGNVLGKVELIPQEGAIIDVSGKPVGKLVEGDAKRLSKMGAEYDAQGQFWDGKGHVIGRDEAIPKEDDEEESQFAGLEGLIVVKDGWGQDENENILGVITKGDPKKLVGRAVDEDGDVIDKRGNVVGHAERYEEPDEPEPEKADLSILKGLTLNKQGNVIGPEGVPIARLVEGNAKELAGRKCDEGQLWNDSGKVVGRCELVPENEREAKSEGPFAGLEGCVIAKDGFIEDEEGNKVGFVVEGDAKRLVCRAVDKDGDIVDKYGNVKGHADPYEEEVEEPVDLLSLAGKVVNKKGNVVDEHGTIFGRIAEGDPASMAGRKVDGEGQIWSDDGKVIGRAELIPGGEQQKPEGPFSSFEEKTVAKDGMVVDQNGEIIGRLMDGQDAKALVGRKVDDDGDILDKSGNVIGKAERYEPEVKERQINPMSGHKVNKNGEIRDETGELLGRVTEGNLPTLIGKKVDDNGYVIDNDCNRVGECTLIENMPEEEPEPEPEMTEEELEALRKKAQDAEIANKMNYILIQTLERIDRAKATHRGIVLRRRTARPKEELDKEEVVKDVKPLLEEGGCIVQECNGAIRGLDPDGSIAANAKAHAASGETTPEKHRLAENLKELTTNVVNTIDNVKKVANMPHAKELSPLWGLLTDPLFQIIAAVGLLLSGVLGLVGKLLNGLGLGSLVNGILGGLAIPGKCQAGYICPRIR
ncbi:MAG: hypothetical protein Q9178_007945 [Gyalolechia marmorata]